MTLVEFLVLGLATWRLSSLIAEEEGPCDILEKARHRLGVRCDKELYQYGENEFAKQLICIWCNSVFVGALWALLWLVSPKVAFALALPLALSAVVVVVNARGIRSRKRWTG